MGFMVRDITIPLTTVARIPSNFGLPNIGYRISSGVWQANITFTPKFKILGILCSTFFRFFHAFLSGCVWLNAQFNRTRLDDQTLIEQFLLNVSQFIVS